MIADKIDIDGEDRWGPNHLRLGMASLLIEQQEMYIERGSTIDYDGRHKGIDS